jgi:hypothetical protein
MRRIQDRARSGGRRIAASVETGREPTFHAKKGETLKFKATVKAHDEYQGERQTVIQRVAATEIVTQS